MSRKILLVDDNVFSCRYTRNLLAITGLEIIEAGNCRQGVEMAISHHPGLILLAAGVACSEDSKVFVDLQKFPSTSKIPVFSVTSRDDEGISESCATTVGLYKRPLPVKALAEKIGTYVNVARSAVNRAMI